jgi:hypothetical protein
MNEDILKIRWSRVPSVYELDAAHALNEEQPAFDQVQIYDPVRAITPEKLRQMWRSFLQRFRRLELKQTLLNREPFWVSLLDLYVPEASKAVLTYKQSDSMQTGPELKILGSGFGGGLSATLSETLGFSAEGIGKALQLKILVTVSHYASNEGDDQVRLEPELPPSGPEYRIVDLSTQAAPDSIESQQWKFLHKADLTGANQGTYTWQRDKTAEATWKVDAGIPIPEALGIKLNWTLKVARSDAFTVKYEIPYGKKYIFYQPSDQNMLAPFCAVVRQIP